MPRRERPPLVPRWVIITVVLSVLGVWMANYIADILAGPKWDPNPLIHVAFLFVVGAAFGVEAHRRRNGNG